MNVIYVRALPTELMVCHAVDMNTTDLQARIAENIKVLLATTGVRSQASLARILDWEPAKVSRLLKGTQEWTLGDLLATGQALGLPDPFLLTRPLIEVVGAAGEQTSAVSGDTVASNPITRKTTVTYSGPSGRPTGKVIPLFPQVRAGGQADTRVA
jgi:hypothetical protein